MTRLLLAVAAFACVALGVARGVPALLAHDEARTAYEEVSAHVGTTEYDAAQSDRVYARARLAHERTGYGAFLVALGLVLFGVLAHPRLALAPDDGLRTSLPPEELAALAAAANAKATTVRRRAPVAMLLDLAVLGLGVALAFVGEAESAWWHALAWSGPVLVIGGQWALLGRGGSVGLRTLGLAVDCASLTRAAFALLALPFAALLLPFTRGRSSTGHLRLVGYVVCTSRR
jgi:hypothetical protein